MGIIYLILAFAATTAGSLAGLGGGIIIKPILDSLGRDSLQTISILSSATVFSMAVVSTAKQLTAGFKIKKIMIFLAAGAVLGGIGGERLFAVVSAHMIPQNLKALQAVSMIVLLTLVLFRRRLPDYEIKNLFVSLLTGALLGLIAAFLGIGGGPVNVAILCMFLAMSIKDAAVISILIILFSQGAKLAMIQISTGFGVYDNLGMLAFMIPGGIAGGLLGAVLNRKLSEDFVHRFFIVIIIGMIGLNIFNTVSAYLPGR